MSTSNRYGSLPSPKLPPTPPPRQLNNICASNAVSCLPYYHPHLSGMEQVKQFLYRYIHVEGSFILRNSMSKPGFFTLSVTHSTGIKHLNVEMTTSTTPYYYLKESKKFENLGDLVNYYGRECVPNKEKIDNVRLLYPIPRAGVSQPVNYYPQPPQQQAPQPPLRAPGNEYDPVFSDDPGEVPDTYIDMSECRLANTVSANPAAAATTVLGRRSDLLYSDYTQIPSELPSKRADLIKQVMLEDNEVMRCDCGLLVEEAMMPRGWSVHLSQHPSSFGEVYFMSPEGQCQWTLPLPVSLELTATQQDLIRDLIFNFEAQTNRVARAKSASSPGGACYMGPPTMSNEDSVHHRSWVAKVSGDSNYVAPSLPAWQPAQSAQIVSAPSARFSIIGQPSLRAPSVVDDDTDNDDYMAMNGAHLRKV